MSVKIKPRWYLLAMLLSQCRCYILRTRCKSFGNFSVIIENSGLHMKDVVSVKHGSDADMCKYECIVTDGCKSFAFNEKDMKCQLYTKSDQDPNDNITLISMQGWIYQSTLYNISEVGDNCKEKQPCGSGKLCMDTCECPGFKCLDIGRCSSNPCVNGGTCVNVGDGYYCNCTKGYFGKNCEITPALCRNSTCKNRGTCNTNVTGHQYCQCTDDFGGEFCQFLKNDCRVQPCKHGDCKYHEHGFHYCDCSDGTTGKFCQNGWTKYCRCRNYTTVFSHAESMSRRDCYNECFARSEIGCVSISGYLVSMKTCYCSRLPSYQYSFMLYHHYCSIGLF